MKLQQEANRKVLELADKAQAEAIRLSVICIDLFCSVLRCDIYVGVAFLLTEIS